MQVVGCLWPEVVLIGIGIGIGLTPIVKRSHLFFFKVPFYQLHRVALIITILKINFTPLCSFRFLYGLT